MEDPAPLAAEIRQSCLLIVLMAGLLSTLWGVGMLAVHVLG